jgi:phosphatidylglycerophosphate synthase
MIALITAMVYWSFRLDFNAFGLNLPEIVYSVSEIVLAVLFWIAAALTVWSGAEYLKAYWKDINPNQ